MNVKTASESLRSKVNRKCVPPLVNGVDGVDCRLGRAPAIDARASKEVRR